MDLPWGGLLEQKELWFQFKKSGFYPSFSYWPSVSEGKSGSSSAQTDMGRVSVVQEWSAERKSINPLTSSQYEVTIDKIISGFASYIP